MRILLLAAAMAIFFSVPTFDAHARKQSPTDDKALIAKLDEEKLISNTLQRLKTEILRNNPGAPNLDLITKDNIQIVAKEPIKAGDTELWMVKIRYSQLPISEADDNKTFDNTVTVDPSGTWQYAEVTNIASAASAFTMAKRIINKIDLPDHFGTPLFKGKGTAKLHFISDPFCPFCRNQYAWLKGNLDKIGEVKMVHLPMPNLHPSAGLASAIMTYAQENLDHVDYVKVVDFAYLVMEEKLRPQRNRETNEMMPPTTEQELEIVKTFVSRFPALKKDHDLESFYYFIKGKYDKSISSEAAALSARYGLRGTPATFVDGFLVYGFNKPELEQLLMAQ